MIAATYCVEHFDDMVMDDLISLLTLGAMGPAPPRSGVGNGDGGGRGSRRGPARLPEQFRWLSPG